MDAETWARALTGLYGPIGARAEQGERFRATVRVRELGAVRMSAVSCPAAEVRTTGPYEARAGGYHLALVLAGELVLDQAGRSARLGPGDLALLDTGRPLRMRLAGASNEMVTVHLGRGPSGTAPGEPERLVARELPGREGPGALVAGFLAGLARDTTPYGPRDALRLGVVAVELAGVLLDHRRGDERGDERGHERGHERRLGDERSHPALLPRIQAYVLDHLGDDRLTPDRIAAAHHISTRYLHRLFQREGLTVAAWIKAQRLERCRRDLADPRLRHLPVHAIAARWGYAQPADFSRAFRAAYGITPTCLRGRSLPTNSARSANDSHTKALQTHS